MNIDKRLLNDSHPVSRWPCCDIRLMNDSRFPWVILVPRFEKAVELFDLEGDDQQKVSGEVLEIAKRMKSHFGAHKMNIATLGNIVSQLHIHVVARFSNDDAWPGPVWGKTKSVPYKTDDLERRLLELQGILSDPPGML